MNKLHPEKNSWQFILTVAPGKELNPEQDAFLFKQGLELNKRSRNYIKRSNSFLRMSLALEELENSLPFLGTSQMAYTLKKEMK